MCDEMHHCSTFGGNNQLAISSSDGVLQVWNIARGNVQQFTPTSHLATTYTCMAWKGDPTRSSDISQRRQKNTKATADQKLLILGTNSGEIFSFNSATNGIVSKFVGHSDRVNDLCWHSEESSVFYSCSKDKYLMEWDVNSNTHSKWKGDNDEIVTVRMGPYGRTLISASTTIKLWDLKTKKLLKRYLGHTSPVVELSFINFGMVKSSEPVEAIEDVNGSYFVSAAKEEKHLCVWQVKASKTRKQQLLMTLLLTNKPRSIDIISSDSDTTNVKVLAVTEEGEVNVFEQKLNGSKNTPVSPSRIIRLSDEDAHPINIVAARFQDSQETNHIQLVYGKQLKLAFDSIDLDAQSESEVCLIRQDPAKTKVTQEVDNVKVRVPLKNDNVKSILPGQVGHSDVTKKRKKESSIGHSVLSMEEQLAAISVQKEDGKDQSVEVKADSLAVLLAQGLKSNDRDILNQVLQRKNESLITKTVNQLKLPSIIPLISELSSRLQGGPDKALTFIRWLRAVLTYHTAFLMTHPEIVQTLTPLFQLMTVRTRSLPQLSRLEGKLDCVISQNLNKTRREENEDPLYVYDEDSDDMDADIIDDQSDSGDEWEYMDGKENEDELMEE